MKKFDKDKYLKKLKFKKIWNAYKRYAYIGFPCLLVVIIGIYFAYSKFSVSKDTEVIRTTVGDFISGDVVLGAYIDGEYSKELPDSNSGYIVEKIVCDNGAVGKWNYDEWGLTVTKVTKRNKCNVYFNDGLGSTIINLAKTDTTNFASDDPDNNVRYIGFNPNNYIYFNCSDYNNQSDSTCEKWRIIGMFNNITMAEGLKQGLVKIVRASSIGNFAFDYKANGTYSNDWSKSTLQQMLNSGAYYNSSTGTYYNYTYNNGYQTTKVNTDFRTTGLKNDLTKNEIAEVVWNLGGVPANGGDYTAEYFYTKERGTSVYSGNPTTWTGKIGLTYSSDSMYAVGNDVSGSRDDCLNVSYVQWCFDYDYCSSYLSGYGGNYKAKWNLTSVSDKSDQSSVDGSNMLGQYLAWPSNYDSDGGNPIFLVFPTLFLKSNVSILKGSGSSSDPYQLKFN